MKFFRIDLLTLLISLFILSGCKNQDGVGLTPDNALSGTLVVDTNIIVNTVKEDTAVTNGLVNSPMGYFKDPQIGTTEANLAFALNLPLNTTYKKPDGVVEVDSAVLILRYGNNSSGFVGDSLNSKYKAYVYQLNERPLPTSSYYNTYNWDYNSAVTLGSRTFNVRPHTSFKVTDIVKGGPDTLRRVPAHIRIPINPSFVFDNLFYATTNVLSSNSQFQAKSKGLFVMMDKNQPGTGGTYSVALDSSSLAVYYHSTYLGAIDTQLIVLPVSTHAAQIKHTYTSPGVLSALANTTSSNSTFYIQSPLGLRAKISFPNLQDIVTKAGGNIVVNRAELVITPVIGTTIPFMPQPKLSMYQYDLAKQRVPLQDANSPTSTSYGDPRYLGVSEFGGFYLNNSTQDYHFLVTGYIQDLIAGKTKDYGTYIGAVDTRNQLAVDYNVAPDVMGRLVAAGTVTDKTSPDFRYKIKLNIIYTKIIK